MPPELLGPLGLTVALALAAAGLWREHLKSDADDRAQRDDALAMARDNVAATNRVADSYTAIAKEIATLTAAVGVIATRITAIERQMAARRRNDL